MTQITDSFFPPAVSIAGSGRVQRIERGTSGQTYLLYGAPFGSSTFVSTDSSRYRELNHTGAGLALDLTHGFVFIAAHDPNTQSTIRIQRRTGAGCFETETSIPNTYGADVLAVASNGDVLAVVANANNSYTAWVGASQGTAWSAKGNIVQNAKLGAFAPSDPTRLYIAFGSSSSLAWIRRSTDGGATWSAGTTVPSAQNTNNATQPYAIAVDPMNPDLVYVVTDQYAANTLFVSTDGGMTFVADAHQPPGGGARYARFTADRKLWVSTAGLTGGLFERDFGATTWTALNGNLTGIEIPANGFDVSANGQDLLRASDNRLWHSANGGAHWTEPAVSGFTGSIVTANMTDPTNEQAFYVAPKSSTAGLYRTTDSGQTYAQVPLPAPFIDTPGIVAVAANGSILMVGNLSGSVSSDHGASWTPMVSVPSPLTPFGGIGGAQPSTLATDRDPSVAWLMSGTDLYRSDDGGVRWAKVSTLLAPNGTGTLYLFPDPTVSKRMLLFINQVDGTGVSSWTFSISTDGGATFTPASTPFAAAPWTGTPPMMDALGRVWFFVSPSLVWELDAGASTWSQRMPPSHSGQLTLVGPYASIFPYRSADGGATWSAITFTNYAAVPPDYFASVLAPFSHRANPKRILSTQGTLRVGVIP